jgi:TolA-binding protein
MEGDVKIATILVLVLLAGISTFVAYKYSQSSLQVKQSLDQERYNRMNAEESLSKSNSRVKELEEQASKLEKKMASMQVILDNTNAMNDDLKSRLDKASLIKNDMEKKINELVEMSSGAPAAQPVTEAPVAAAAPIN